MMCFFTYIPDYGDVWLLLCWTYSCCEESGIQLIIPKWWMLKIINTWSMFIFKMCLNYGKIFLFCPGMWELCQHSGYEACLSFYLCLYCKTILLSFNETAKWSPYRLWMLKPDQENIYICITGSLTVAIS